MPDNLIKSNGTFLAIFLHPEQSGYNASLALAENLRQRGHRVVYIGYHKYEDFIRNRNFEFICILDKEVYEKLIKQPGPKGVWEINRGTKKNIELWLETEKPGLVLLDQFAWEQAGAFLKKNIPVLPVNTCLASGCRFIVPPVFSSIIPSKRDGKPSFVRSMLAWGKIRLFHGILSFINRKVLPPFIEDITQNGVALEWGEYGRRLQLPELVLCPCEFDFPIVRKTFNQRIYAGACVPQTTNDESFDWRQIDTAKKIVYASIGTHQRYAPRRIQFYEAIIDAFKDRPHLQLILHVANPDDILRRLPLPANIVTREWLPQTEVLSKASLFITHGGLSSIRESIFYGVPMLVFPWGVDQPGNAARVAYHGLGLAGNSARIDAKAIGNMMDQVLENEVYSDACRKMSDIFQRQKECLAGVEAVERMLS